MRKVQRQAAPTRALNRGRIIRRTSAKPLPMSQSDTKMGSQLQRLTIAQPGAMSGSKVYVIVSAMMTSTVRSAQVRLELIRVATQNQYRNPATMRTSLASSPAARTKSFVSPNLRSHSTPIYGANSRRIS